MKKETIHQGHRQRLTNLVDNAGLENLSDVQAVEYLLTFVFPRGDVNPLAHRLLNHFGNIANILALIGRLWLRLRVWVKDLQKK